MKFLNSITSWLDLQVGFSKKAQMCLIQERLGGQSAVESYHCRGDDIIPELREGKPILSGVYYLYEVSEGGLFLIKLPEVMKYNADTGLWLDKENSFIRSYTHYIHVSEHSSVMEKALKNAKLRISNET